MKRMYDEITDILQKTVSEACETICKYHTLVEEGHTTEDELIEDYCETCPLFQFFD